MSVPQLGYVILFVPSPAESLAFFTKAFGFTDTFLHEAGDYGEVRTGGTKLAFTSHTLAAAEVPFPYRTASPADRPGMEVTLTTPDVDGAYARAVAAGAEALAAPHDTAWGQRVAYVADPHGHAIGVATPMA